MKVHATYCICAPNRISSENHFFAKETGCFGRMYDPGVTRSHHCFKKCYVFSLVSCRCLERQAPLSEGHVIILDSEALPMAVETHLIS